MKQLIVDPSNGWLYGFPKAVPEEFLTRSGETVTISDDQRSAFSDWLKAECEGNEIYSVRRWIKEV